MKNGSTKNRKCSEYLEMVHIRTLQNEKKRNWNQTKIVRDCWL